MSLTDRVRGAGGITFSDDRKRERDELSDASVQSTLHAYQRYYYHNDNSNWNLVRRQGGLRVYSDRKAQSSSDATRYTDDGTLLLTLMCTGFVRGSIQDIISTLDLDINDDDIFLTKLRLASNAYKDSTVLKWLEKNDTESSVMSASLRWTYMKLGMPGISERQVISYDRCGQIMDEAGNKFTYQTIQTLSLPELPEHIRLPIPELPVKTCYLFRHFKGEYVGVFTVSEIRSPHKFLSPFLEFIAGNYVNTVSSYVTIGRAKAYSALMESDVSVVATRSDICGVCSCAPTMFSRNLKTCKGCGRFTCRKCLHRRKLLRRTGLKIHESLFCAVCVATVERVDQSNISSSNSSGPNSKYYSESTSSGMSSSMVSTSWDSGESSLSMTSGSSNLERWYMERLREDDNANEALQRALSSLWSERNTDLARNTDEEEEEEVKTESSNPHTGQ